MNKMSNLRFTQIETTDDVFFEKAMNIYNEAFPSNEKQPLGLIKKRLNEKKSILYVGLFGEKVICMAFLWNFHETEFTLLDYMAVDKEERNNNAGSSLFKFLSDKAIAEKKYLIMEVESDLSGPYKEIIKKRINFYIRNGGYVLDKIPYILPALDNTTPTQMFLMIAPKYHERLIQREKIEKLIIQLYSELYCRNEDDAILQSILHNTPNTISQLNNIPI